MSKIDLEIKKTEQRCKDLNEKIDKKMKQFTKLCKSKGIKTEGIEAIYKYYKKLSKQNLQLEFKIFRLKQLLKIEREGLKKCLKIIKQKRNSNMR